MHRLLSSNSSALLRSSSSCASTTLLRMSAVAASSSSSASSSSTSSSSSSSRLSIPLSTYTQLESQFRTHVGSDSISRLKSLPPPSHPIIVIAGDQCTGKSTLAKRLATHLNGRHFSAGEFFRARAKEMGISSAELSRRALSDPSIDVGIEYSLCELICRGDASSALVIEGRQPAVMENYIRTTLQRQGATFRLRLCCTTHEQAQRFLQREYPALHSELIAYLPQNASKLSEYSHILKSLPPSKLTQHPELASIIRHFEDNDTRDEDDRKRYEALYGKSKFLDQRTPELYDVVLDTSHNQPDDTFRTALQAMEPYLKASNTSDMQSKSQAKL